MKVYGHPGTAWICLWIFKSSRFWRSKVNEDKSCQNENHVHTIENNNISG